MTLPDLLAAAVAQGRAPDLHGVVVVQHGSVILEHYGEGQDFTVNESLGHVRFTSSTLHDIRSVTKSVVGLLYGIALADGVVPSPSATLRSAFPEYPDLSTDRGELTVEHALTMTLGLDWNENVPYTSTANSEIAMEVADDRYAYILSRDIVEKPGTRWSYCGGATALLGRLIERGTGAGLREYASARLLGPLGIDTFDWSTSPRDGVALAASGLRLTPRDMATIGELVLAGGRDIVPAPWLAAALRPHVPVDASSSYGYQWYVGDTWVAAFGNGGQRIYASSALDLVVAITAGQYNADQTTSWYVLDQVILPAVTP